MENIMEEHKNLAFPLLSTNVARDKLVRDLLQKAHTGGIDLSRDKQVEKAYELKFGFPFFKYAPTSTNLRGFPGQGKTTAYKAAAKEVAEMLSMNLIVQPERPIPISKNDIVLTIVNLSGEVSNMAVSGVPKVIDEKDVQGNITYSYTQRMPPFGLAASASAGLAIIVMDDMPNASPNIQNIANDLLDQGKAQGLDLGQHALVGATGNLGAIDGTHVSATSSATATRANNYMVEDNVSDWCERTINLYSDAVSDAGVTTFLKRHPDYFHKPTKNKKGEPYPTARSWSRAVEEHFRPMMAAIHHLPPGTDPNIISLPAIEMASGLIGTETAEKLGGFYASYINDSLPLAEEIMKTGALSDTSKDVLAQRYSDGVSDDQETFLMQFYSALCDKASQMMVEQHVTNPNKAAFSQTVNNLMTGFYGLDLNTSHLGYAADYLSNRLISLAKNDEIGVVHPTSQMRILNPKFLDAFTKVAGKHRDAMAKVNDDKTVFEDTVLDQLMGNDVSFDEVKEKLNNQHTAKQSAAVEPTKPKPTVSSSAAPQNTPSPAPVNKRPSSEGLQL